MTLFGGAVSTFNIELVGTYTNVSTANTSTGVIPATTQAGDLIIYWDFVPNWTSGAQPSGFTLLNLGEVAAVDARVSCKIATSGDAGTTITGATGSDYAVMILVFRGTSSFATFTGADWNSGNTNNVSFSDTIPSSGYHIYLCSNSSRDGVPNPPFTSVSPALQGTVATGGSAESLTVGYSIFINNGTTQSVTVPNTSSRFIAQAGYITLTV